VQWSKSKWANNTVNNTSTSLGIDILEARANTSSYSDKATDLYPKGSTQFLKMDNYHVTNIVMDNRIITFDVNDGGQMIVLEVGNVQSDDVQCTKVLYNGQVYIIRDGKIYDLFGRKISE
jgi:hypothetical protein